MTRPHVLQMGKVSDHQLTRLRRSFEVTLASEVADMDAFLVRRGDGIRGVTTNGLDGLPRAVMDRLPALEIISVNSVGYDPVDVAEAVRRGILVTHTPGVLDKDVANIALALMLATSRRLVRDDRWLREGNWKSRFGGAPLTRSIEGAKVGIVGMGRIGKEIARKLSAAFDCDIAYNARTQKPELPWRFERDLVALARAVDYLILITPGGPETAGMVNRAVLDALGPQGTLINVARGSVVDEAELVAALLEGRLGAAGLDVFADEPNVPKELLPLDNVVLLPHVASATEETRRAMADLTVDNLENHFAGRPVKTPVPECQ
ncbi:MAG: 2-hydroxyacid dehydrogenase [Notoacmeibacter sp.]|nr:2-hydroxyacid dehydrogenase [Notoacmeibacter sp.]